MTKQHLPENTHPADSSRTRIENDSDMHEVIIIQGGDSDRRDKKNSRLRVMPIQDSKNSSDQEDEGLLHWFLNFLRCFPFFRANKTRASPFHASRTRASLTTQTKSKTLKKR